MINETSSFSFTLVPSAYVTVTSNIKKSRIIINGRNVGMGEINNYPVAQGDVLVNVEASGFEPFTRKLTLDAGEHEVITVQLTSIFGQLNISSVPTGAEVFLNNKQVGETPYYNDRLQPGNFVLKLQLDSYDPIKTNINIVKNTSIKKEFKLKRSMAYIDSVASIQKQSQWFRRIMFGVLSTGFIGVGVYYNMKIEYMSEDLEKIQNAYRLSTSEFDVYRANYTNKQKDISDAQTNRNIFYGLAGVFMLGLAVSIPF